METCYKVANPTKVLPKFPAVQRESVTGGLIPGTFYAWDRLPVLFEFVRGSLVDGWQPFELIAPGSQKLSDSEDIALAECNLVSVTHVRAPAAPASGSFLSVCVCLHLCSGPRSSAHVCLGCSRAGRHRSSGRKEPLPPQTRAVGKASDPELKASTAVPSLCFCPSCH